MRTRAAGDSQINPRSFEGVLAAFVLELRARWYSKAMVKHAHTTLGRFFAYLGGRRIRDLRAVDEAEVFAYARQLAEAKSAATGERYSPATQRTHLYLVKRLFRFLLRAGVVLQDPTLNLQVPVWSSTRAPS